MQRPYIYPYAYSLKSYYLLLLLLPLCYYHRFKTVATDKPLRASLFPHAAKLITHLLRLINILWLPLCRINKFGFYFPRRLLRSPILVGHQGTSRPVTFLIKDSYSLSSPLRMKSVNSELLRDCSMEDNVSASDLTLF
jgi:hypothetical protein